MKRQPCFCAEPKIDSPCIQMLGASVGRLSDGFYCIRRERITITPAGRAALIAETIADFTPGLIAVDCADATGAP